MITKKERKLYPNVAGAFDYISGVLDGSTPACEFVKLACKRQIDDLEKNWEYEFDFVKAERICIFIQRLPHVKGHWAAEKKKLKLEPWQQFILTTAFGWVKKSNGMRRFLEIYGEIPRKNGKSIIAAGIGDYMFCADGEYGSEIYSGATTEKQAWEVFRPAKLMVERTPELQSFFGIQVNAKNLYIEKDGSRFEPVIGNPGDGSSPSCALVDEYHEHATDVLFDAMKTGMGSREQPMIVVITTAGVNIAGPCYAKRDYLIKVLKGTIHDERMFGIIYTLDKKDEWTDPESLKKANPNYNVSVSEDFLLAQLATAIQNTRLQNVFKTKHCNIWCGAKNAWINLQEWGQAPDGVETGELIGRRCFTALDLASKIDIAAKVNVFPPDGEDPNWQVICSFYLPEDMVENGGPNASHYQTWAKLGFLTLTPGAIIDFEYIEEDLKSDASLYAVEEIPYDPYQATQIATRMVAEGLPMVEYGATVKNFSEPMKFVESLVKENKLAHRNNPVLAWMASNVTAKMDQKDNIYPNKDLADNKIDGMVALIMAVGRAIVFMNDSSSFWEN